LSSFCENVTLLSCFGTKDQYIDFAKKHLPDNVKLVPFMRKDTFTTVKRRYVDPAFHHKLFEIHFFDDTPLGKDLEGSICSYLSDRLGDFDLVVVGDFGHGLMTKGIIEPLCCSKKFLAITVQTNSDNYGFNYVTKYPRADYVALDEREVRLACHDRFADIRSLVSELTEKLKSSRFAVTLGREGSMIQDNGAFRKAPIVTTRVVDTIGSGDAFLALSALAAFLNAPAAVLLFLGNVAGAMAANIVGNNEKIDQSEYKKFIHALLK
jgi:bifunctional ADP-heptose synthase (sugar kinase/adenylyltransferase)